MLRAEGQSYEPTQRDVLWLLRAVASEGKPHEGVAKTLVSGFLWARARRGFGGTLADWVRAYSQPVNPRWLRGGDLYEARMTRARARGQSELARKYERQANRRARAQRRTEFPADVRAAVETALSEGTTQPATDFAAWWAKPDPNRTPITPEVPGENRFYTRDSSWPGYSGTDGQVARTLVSRTASTVKAAGGAALLAMLGLAVLLGGTHG